MKESMKKFMEEVKSNEELKTKIAEIENGGSTEAVKKMVSLAAEYGYELKEEDFVVQENGELSEEDLEDVAGGFPGLYRPGRVQNTREYA